MAKKTISPTLVTETACRAAKLSVTLLLTAAALAAVANHATAQEVDPSIADSDGIVPIYSVCFGSDASELYVPGAAYIPYYDGTSVQGIILFDECAAQELGLGPTDIQRALEHELGHARGLLHSNDPSNIMYPVQTITGT